MLRSKARLLIAGLGAALLAGMPSLHMPTIEPMPFQAWNGGGRHRGRWPGKRKPAGSKLARLAREGRVGITH